VMSAQKVLSKLARNGSFHAEVLSSLWRHWKCDFPTENSNSNGNTNTNREVARTISLVKWLRICTIDQGNWNYCCVRRRSTGESSFRQLRNFQMSHSWSHNSQRKLMGRTFSVPILEGKVALLGINCCTWHQQHLLFQRGAHSRCRFFDENAFIRDSRRPSSHLRHSSPETIPINGSLYHQESSAALIIFDITNKKSFVTVRYWTNEVSTHLENFKKLSLGGKKSDLLPERKVSFQKGDQWADQEAKSYFEISAEAGPGGQHSVTIIPDQIQ
jgi:hypothetical protein